MISLNIKLRERKCFPESRKADTSKDKHGSLGTMDTRERSSQHASGCRRACEAEVRRKKGGRVPGIIGPEQAERVISARESSPSKRFSR